MRTVGNGGWRNLVKTVMDNTALNLWSKSLLASNISREPHIAK